MRLAVVLLLSVALLGCKVQFNHGPGESAQPRSGSEAEQAAIRATASEVLALLDAEQWDKAWSGAGTPLKQTAPLSAFTMGVRASRAMFGAPKSRTIVGYQFPDSLEGAPPGQYGIVFYGSDFAKVEGVQEQVVLIYENGKWRLAGYWAEKTKNVKLL